MSTEGTVDCPIEVIGGLITNVAPSDLPHGVSPDLQDIQFQIGSGKTRPGTTALYTLAGNPTVNYLKTYENLQEVPRFLSLDSLGVLRKDVTPGGALTPIYSGILPNCWCRSCSLFGREYFGFGNPFEGLDIPRQYDDTNFDRISQVGPGTAPTASDEAISFTIAAAGVPGAAMLAPQTVLSGSEVGNTCTLQLSSFGFGNPMQVKAGDQVTIAGVTPAGYNGTFTVAADMLLKTPSTGALQYFNPTSGLGPITVPGTAQFPYANITFTTNQTANANFPLGVSALIAGVAVGTYNGTWRVAWTGLGSGSPNQIFVDFGNFGIANSGGGTASVAGNVAAGKHQLSVIFVTRTGYYTKPAPPNNWIAGGNKRVVIGNIPIGPPNVIARVLCFTAVAQSSFYHLGPTGLTIFSSNMYIADNTTTQLTVDFSDQILLLGTLDDPLFNQIELPPIAGTIDYSSRLFAWGEQGNLQAFLNLTFDGGFSNLTSSTTGTSPNFPLGWLLDATSSAGGGSANVGGKSVIFGDAYTITGDGVTAIRGKVSQTAVLDYLLNPILQPNTAYTIRARIYQIGAVAGTVHVNLQSTSGAFTTAGISQAAGTLSGSYALYTGNLTSGLATIPSDLVLQMYADGTPTNNGVFVIDNIEIFPTNAQFNNSNVRASTGQLNTQGQESFDSENGLIQYNLNDGTSVRNMFKIRERLYIVKEHSFGVTQDDGVNEPANWTVDDVSKKVGTLSTNGVGVGEDWVVIAHRTGLYIFWGGGVEKITQEIQQLWDTINWQYGYLISVTVDTRRRRIFICAPFGAATTPNKTLVLDYHDVGSDASDIAANPPIHLTYTGAKRAFDRARKWCPWTISANSVAQIEQANGTTQVYFGSNDTSGNILLLDSTDTIFTDAASSVLLPLATDNFNRANQNPINTNWIIAGGGFVAAQVLGNQYIGQNAGNAGNIYDGGVIWPNDQFSQATLLTLAVNSGLTALTVRGNILNQNNYALVINALGTSGIGQPCTVTIQKFPSIVLATAIITPQSGDVFKIQVAGTLITCYQNGALILSAIDSDVASGKPGIEIEATGAAANIAWDNWSGGAVESGVIPSYYTTAFLPDRETKQGMQLSQHRILFSYLTTYMQGNGTVGVTIYRDSLSNAIALNPQTLTNPAIEDIEMGVNQTIERMAVKFSSSGSGQWFDLQNMVLNAQTDPWAPVRGMN